jgi:flagellar biosynthetic protein FliR
MPTFQVNFSELSLLLAVFLRLSVIIFMLPIFNNTHVPNMVKACVIIALTGVLYPFLHQTTSPPSILDPVALACIALSELMLGTVLALSILFILDAFQMAGELISFEMGFGFAQAADPQNGTQSMLFSIWFQVLATVLFFGINGHHFLLKAVIESFKNVPVGAFALKDVMFQKIILLSGQLFVIAIKISAPVMIVLLLTQIGLGMVSKFAPQINILMTSFPVTIFVGLLFMSFSVLIWGDAMQHLFQGLFQTIHSLLSTRTEVF